MDRRALGLFVLVAVLCLPHVSRAQLTAEFSDAPLEIEAEVVEYEYGRDVFVARGNVRLIQEDRELTADWLSFSQRGGRGVASGNVVYTESGKTVYANFVEFSTTTRQGVLYKARFDDAEHHFRMEGEVVVKTGEDTYLFENGKFTTCECPDEGTDPWQIRAGRADIELEEYAFVRNTTFNVLGVPVLWLPWMAYPIATDRESGVLFPEVGHSKRSGYEVGVPFFWAARPNLNLTMTPRWLQDRGIKGDVKAEYVLGEHSSGEIEVSYIHDRKFETDIRRFSDPLHPGKVFNFSPASFDRDRWSVKGKQDIHFPKDWRLKSEFKAMSDNEHAFDFQDLRKYRRDRYLDSNVFLSKHLGASGRVGFVGSALIADDLQSPNHQDRDRYMLQRLPNLEFTVLPAPSRVAKWLAPSLDLQYAYFGQWENPAEIFEGITPVGDDLFFDVGIDAFADDVQQAGFSPPKSDLNRDNFTTAGGGPGGGPEGNGIFDEGEPLADRGQRIQIAPRLAMPFRLGNAFELYPEVGWRHSVYKTRAQGLKNWGALTVRADLQTRLKRAYRDGITHLMEPRIGYGLLSVPNISSDPLFVPFTRVPQRRIRQGALDNVIRDESDRIEDFNGMTVGVGNRFYRRGSDSAGPRLLADLNLFTQYNFLDGGDLGDIFVDGVGELGPRTRFRFNAAFDPEAIRLDEGLAAISWSSKRALSTSLSYRYIHKIPRFFEDFRSDDRFEHFDEDFNHVDQVDLRLTYRVTDNWKVRYQVARSFESKSWLGRRGSIEYTSKCDCWAFGVKVNQDPQGGLHWGLTYRLVGLGNDLGGETGAGLSGFGFLDGN